MSNSDLFQALNMFNQGVKEAATTAAINDAHKGMQQIQTGIQDEAEQRQAFEQLSRETALRLAGTGASGTQIDTAFKSIAPPQFGSAEQMELYGRANGSQHLTQTAGGIMDRRQREKKDLLNHENMLQMRLMDRRALQEIALSKAKGASKTMAAPGFEFAPGYTPTEKDVEDLKTTSAAFSTIMGDLKRLDQMVEKSGTEALTAPQFLGGGQDKNLMLQTKEGITLTLKELEKLGALAGPDVEVLAKAMPDPTATRTSTYVKQSENFKKMLDNRIQKRAQSRGARWLGGSSVEQLEQSAIKTVRYKGQMVRVQEVAPGKYQLIED